MVRRGIHQPEIQRPRSQRRPTLLWFVALLISLATFDRDVAADEMEQYRLAAQQPGSDTYALGVGIASLVKLIVLPHNSVDLDVAITSGFLESFALVSQGDTQFALLKANWQELTGGEADKTRPSGRSHQHSVAALATFRHDNDQSTKLVARNDVDERIIYEVTKAIFENLPYLSQIDSSLAEMTVDDAAVNTNLPLHAGAKRYFDEIAAISTAVAENGTGAQEAKTFVVYFDLDRAAITAEGAATLDELQAFAGTLDTPKIWIAGYTDTTGSADYNLDLAKRRADAVLTELRSRKISARNLDLTAFGERSPWVVTADQTIEARNRRVEILVEPGKESVVIGRAESPTTLDPGTAQQRWDQ